MRIKNALSIIIVIALHTGLVFGQSSTGDFTGYRISGKQIIVEANPAAIIFTFYRSDIVRVDLLPDGNTAPDTSRVVVQDTSEAISYTLSESESEINIQTAGLTIRLDKFPLRIHYETASGMPLLDEPSAGGFLWNGDDKAATFMLDPADHFYGTGERGLDLDLRGYAFTSYNTQVYGYGSPVPSTMNINIPFLSSARGYALYFENNGKAEFDLGVYEPDNFYYHVYGGVLSYFFIAGETVPDQIEAYTWLTGRQPLPPKWALGYLQSKFGYRNENEARNMVSTMRAKNIPADAIILDLYWFQNMGDLSWDFGDWPDPAGMTSDFMDRGFKTIVITEPYFTQYSRHYSDLTGSLSAYSAMDAFGNPYILSNWWSCGCNAVLFDITNPDAREWLWNEYRTFMDYGVAGVWTDLGEPENHPVDMVHFLGGAREIHNLYNLLWAKTVYEGFSDYRPNERVVNLTRSGYAGIQRYGVFTWSGDVSRTFGGLAVQPALMLNTGISGLAYHSSDLGGFTGTSSPELYIRWIEFGAFNPVMRAHGVDNQSTEPWGFGTEAEAISKKFIQLRYRLLPYLYTLAYENYTTGMPIARPLFFADPDDPALTNDEDSFLFGENILVSPVVQSGQRSKTFYLPSGRWFDFWTDQIYEGGRSVSVDAPLDQIPLFIKAGSIIPMQPVMNYVDEFPVDTLTLTVYPDPEADASFILYEDDNNSLEYQLGSYTLTNFSQSFYTQDSKNIMMMIIGASEGSYAGMPADRVYLAEIHQVNSAPERLFVDNAETSAFASLVLLRQSENGYYYDPDNQILYVQSDLNTTENHEIKIEDINISTPVEHTESLPLAFSIRQNYPNPFNPSTTIEYTIPQISDVEIAVFDISGRRIDIPLKKQQRPGLHRFVYQPHAGMASGVYFYLIRATSGSRILFSGTGKMLYLK
ncbi:MAG: TIM-barrel domain-containing protein [Calditrichaceae bacterium]